jgi:hypothetical protein
MNEGPYFGDLRNNEERVDDPCLIGVAFTGHQAINEVGFESFAMAFVLRARAQRCGVVDGESKSPI